VIGRVVLATRNEGKARELEELLGGTALKLETLRDHPDVALPPEEGNSYAENALAKARAVSAALGAAAIGDDSGLEVDALDGAPGMRSARFSGENANDAANNALLLARLQEVPAAGRAARFRCALAFVEPGGRELCVEGACEGSILVAPRGDRGFGYDPLFLPHGETRTFAELPQKVKDSISHRARAAAALRAALSR
jgi:XTP/dITP diphosphohydrolase